MNFNLKYIIKVSAILAIIIFLIERLLFNGGFNLPINELFIVLSIHFMYAFVLTTLNSYFFYSIWGYITALEKVFRSEIICSKYFSKMRRTSLR